MPPARFWKRGDPGLGSKGKREPGHDLAWLEEERGPDLTSATPLQVLEHLAVNGRSETARVQALKVLVDRQQQLEREREDRRELPDKCPECIEREKDWVPDDELAAKVMEQLFEMGVLLPKLLRDVLVSAEGSGRLATWIREEVLTDVQSVEAEIERRTHERLQAMHSAGERR